MGASAFRVDFVSRFGSASEERSVLGSHKGHNQQRIGTSEGDT